MVRFLFILYVNEKQISFHSSAIFVEGSNIPEDFVLTTKVFYTCGTVWRKSVIILIFFLIILFDLLKTVSDRFHHSNNCYNYLSHRVEDHLEILGMIILPWVSHMKQYLTLSFYFFQVSVLDFNFAQPLIPLNTFDSRYCTHCSSIVRIVHLLYVFVLCLQKLLIIFK